MKFPVVNVDTYLWDLRIQVRPTYVPALDRAVLREISFQINPLYKNFPDGDGPASRLHLEFYVENCPMSRAQCESAIQLLRKHLDPRFAPTGSVRVNFCSRTEGSYRIPLNLPKCNFSKHALSLLKQVVVAWGIDWCSPGLDVTRRTMVKVRGGRYPWTSFSRYLEMKDAGEI